MTQNPDSSVAGASVAPVGTPIRARLDQDVENIAVLVHRAPQVLLATVACDEHRIEILHVSKAPAPLPKLSCIRAPERSRPAKRLGQNGLARAALVACGAIVEQLVG